MIPTTIRDGLTVNHHRQRRQEWVAIRGMSVGLVIFVLAERSASLHVGLTCLALAGMCVLLMKKGQRTRSSYGRA